MDFTSDTLATPAGLKALNEYLSTRSYIDGFAPTQSDVTIWRRVSNGACPKTYPHVVRWCSHIASFTCTVRCSWPKGTSDVADKQAAAKPAAGGAKPAEKKEAADEDSDSDDDDDDDDPFAANDSDDDEETRAMMAKKADQIKAIQARQAAKADQRKSNLTLDIKPYDSETDMEDLTVKVKQIKMDGLKWLGHSLIPVAFGVKKIRILCQIVDVLVGVDDLREQIEDMEDVQSTDIFNFCMA